MTYTTTYECRACPADSLSAPGSTSEWDCKCNSGFFVVWGYQMSCEACPSPSSSPPGSQSQSACVCDTGYSLENSNQRRRSAAADVSKLSGPVSTRDHDMGHTSMYTCQACSPMDLPPVGCNCNGYYGSTDACSPCPENSVSVKGAGNVADCKCNQGFYASTDSSSCHPCPVDSVPVYDPQQERWDCNCSAGLYAIGRSSSSRRSSLGSSTSDTFLRDHDTFVSAPTCGTEPAATGILQCNGILNNDFFLSLFRAICGLADLFAVVSRCRMPDEF
jgi:hypothetical protein